MFWPLLIPLFALGAGALATSRTLRAGHTYRFTASLEPPQAMTEADWTALLAALQANGARDVLLLRGSPIVGMYTQDVAVTHTVQLGRWIEFSIRGLGLFRVRLDSAEEIEPGA